MRYINFLTKKNRTIEIPKKNGGKRIIKSPNSRLKNIQSKLHFILSECLLEIRERDSRYDEYSYGYIPKKNIIKNSILHSRKKFVFNVDLADFFGSINFGRVRGFFINDHYFRLEPDVATVIAKIACHDNSLPQGSPCSPIISNMIGRILDIHLRDLARKYNIEYSRYVDDITFSSNEKVFPSEIAFQSSLSDWSIGKRLSAEIENAGFKVNANKIRMSKRQKRQVVTGLTVNDKPNVQRDFLKYTRAMCDSYFKNGNYFIEVGKERIEEYSNGNILRGRLSYIYYIQQRKDREKEQNKIYLDKGEFSPPKEMVHIYRDFLLFSYFVKMDRPLLVTEGKTDISYLKKAIRSRLKKYPELGGVKGDGSTEYYFDFFNPSVRNQELLELGVGVIGQKKLIQEFSSIKKKFKFNLMNRPVIIICDNDDGPKGSGLFSLAKNISNRTISIETTEKFYHLIENLYLIKTPENGKEYTSIEDLFPDSVLNTKLSGKSFDSSNNADPRTTYGKAYFADYVVSPNWKTIDFSKFDSLLDRVVACIADYRSKSDESAAPVEAA